MADSIYNEKTRMLYLKNITDSQDLRIPRDGNMTTGFKSLILKSTIDQDERIFNISSSGNSANYFEFKITLQDNMPNGEYEYTLKDGGLVLSRGLLILGDVESHEEYNKTITYEQYEY